MESIRILRDGSKLYIVLFSFYLWIDKHIKLIMGVIVVVFVTGLVELLSPVGRGILGSVDDVVLDGFIWS